MVKKGQFLNDKCQGYQQIRQFAAVAGFAINTGFWYGKLGVTKGDIGRTAAYTGIDVVMDIGPLEGMTIGAHFGPVGAAVGLGVGALSQGVQFVSKRVFGFDIGTRT